ncbi:hypothetical protein Taro_048364 [Colocasia esculenta]|uniref:Uncharacterized protein n=1 Tax=Colocasia esculenta TaxID=4460 RepID=A0A843X7U0_COLES|nr:hypothetical protein [Colocasia esculenta]
MYTASRTGSAFEELFRTPDLQKMEKTNGGEAKVRLLHQVVHYSKNWQKPSLTLLIRNSWARGGKKNLSHRICDDRW